MSEVIDMQAGTTLDVADLAVALLDTAKGRPGQVDEALRDQLRRLELTPGEREAVLEKVREAQLREARLKRRTAELEALFSTARELVSLQDVDDVLGRLVERAHGLMDTDVTYLSEFDSASGGLNVRYSVGTVTPAFHNLSVPPGFGLCSKVVQDQTPLWVARYDTMTDAPRAQVVDTAVCGEGLVSFLGVPLVVGDEVLGALFACNRHAHESTPDEILLLSAFADHAAEVLYSARLLAAAEAAKTNAERSYQELQRHVAATELVSTVHEELTDVVISGGSVVDIVSTLAKRLDRRVLALDSDGHPLCGEMPDLPAGMVPQSVHIRDAIAKSQASGHVVSVRAAGTGWLVSAILGSDRVHGAILAEENSVAAGLPDDIATRTLERASHVAALVSFKREAIITKSAQARARWLTAVLGGGNPPPDGGLFTPPEDLTGCAVLCPGEQKLTTATAFARHAAGNSGIVADLDGLVVVAWTADDPAAATERVRTVVAQSLRTPELTAVVSARRLETAELAECMNTVTGAAQLLPALGANGSTVSAESLSPYLALIPRDPVTVERFVVELVGPVLAWDEKRGTDLFTTLTAYFETSGSRQAVARQLHIHPNTVQQRMERVEKLLPGGLDAPEMRFRLESAVRLENLRRMVRN